MQVLYQARESELDLQVNVAEEQGWTTSCYRYSRAQQLLFCSTPVTYKKCYRRGEGECYVAIMGCAVVFLELQLARRTRAARKPSHLSASRLVSGSVSYQLLASLSLFSYIARHKGRHLPTSPAFSPLKFPSVIFEPYISRMRILESEVRGQAYVRLRAFLNVSNE